MLTAGAADTGPVVSRILTAAAWICCVLVFASFALFVRDELAAGSEHQQQLIAATPASAPVPTARPVGQPRRFIDGAAHVLVSPFEGIVATDSQWVLHGVTTGLALVLYGFGLGFLARYTKGLG